MIKVNAIQCSKCGDTIYSRTHYDCRSCSCGSIFIDGGFDYTRIGSKEEKALKVKKININATKKELYEDWNLTKGQFGLIKDKKKGNKKLIESIKQGMKDLKEGKVTKVKDLDKFFKEL